MTDLPKISNSQTEALLSCERKHYYSYGLGIQRVAKSDSLSFGTFMHSILELHFNLFMKGMELSVIRKMVNTFMLEQMGTMTPEQVKSARTIYDAFIEADPFKGYQILAVEKEFTVEIAGRFQFQFIIDLIVRDPQGRIVVVDHKTTYDFYQDYTIENMGQLPKYVGALRLLGHDVAYAMYHQLRTRKPRKDATHEDLIRLMKVSIPDARIKQTFHEQIIAADRIIARQSGTIEEWNDTALRVNNSMMCKNCSFRNLCQAEQREDPATNVIYKTEYMTKPPRDDEENAEEGIDS